MRRKKLQVLEVQSFGLDTGPHNRFATQRSAQKFAVQVCQVATVVAETMQLVLSQF